MWSIDSNEGPSLVETWIIGGNLDMKHAATPDATNVDQQRMILDSDGGAAFDDRQRGVDTTEITRQQPVAAQQVSPLDVHLIRLAGLVDSQHLQAL